MESLADMVGQLFSRGLDCLGRICLVSMSLFSPDLSSCPFFLCLTDECFTAFTNIYPPTGCDVFSSFHFSSTTKITGILIIIILSIFFLYDRFRLDAGLDTLSIKVYPTHPTFFGSLKKEGMRRQHRRSFSLCSEKTFSTFAAVSRKEGTGSRMEGKKAKQ